MASSSSLLSEIHAIPKATANMSTFPEVALVWERSSVTSRSTHAPIPCIKVSLQPMEPEDEKEMGTAVLDVQPETVDSNIIPESVLLYERQLRKAQHAKKTGQLLPEELKIIYEDEWLVVVNKPAGVLTVPGLNNHPSLLDRVHALYGERITDPANMIVHRLDMDTSGLVVFARSLEVSKQMHAIFRDRKVTKEYECLVVGHLHLPKWPNDNQATDDDTSSSTLNKILIDLPLQRDHEHPPFMRVSTPQSEAAAMACVDQLQRHGWKKIMRKPAKPSQSLLKITEVGTKEALPYTRLRLEPITGRTHQLRVHCAAIGFPIVGDPTYSLYGEAAMFGGLSLVKSCQRSLAKSSLKQKELSCIDRCSMDIMKAWTVSYPPNEKPMCLHAAYLELIHPLTGDLCQWHAPPEF